MHSKDTTILIDLLWFNFVYHTSLFQYFSFDLAMESTTMEAFIKHLQQIFATHGISYQIVSDNGPQFTAEIVYLVEFSTPQQLLIILASMVKLKD